MCVCVRACVRACVCIHGVHTRMVCYACKWCDPTVKVVTIDGREAKCLTQDQVWEISQKSTIPAAKANVKIYCKSKCEKIADIHHKQLPT